MVYRFKNIRTDFGLGNMPEDNIVYSRKGGCFVSTCKGFCISFFTFMLLSLVIVIVFYSTKHAYEKVTGITLEEFAKKPSPFIDKGDLISKSLQPKHYRLIIHPIFEDQHHPFTFNGTVWIVLTAKKGNNLRKIELNVKELHINDEDVDVYRSYRTPTLDYKNLLDWDDDEDEIVIQRRKRQEEEYLNVTSDEVLNETTISSIEDDLSTTTVKSSESSTVARNDENEDENTAAVELNRIDRDKENEKIIIWLDADIKRYANYVVKIKFSGHMTRDRGLFYTAYTDEESSDQKYLAATFTDMENARSIFPCFDDHDFQSTFDVNIVRSESMSTASSTRISHVDELHNGFYIDNYQTTPPIPTSQLGFVITHMDAAQFDINDNLTVRFYARHENFDEANYTATVIESVLDLLENYTGIPFHLNKLNYVAVPNIGNFKEIKSGLILSSEKYILVNQSDSNSFQRSIDHEISYELSYQWLNNFRNYENEEETWLMEAFPLFLQHVVLDDLKPNSGNADKYMIENRFQAMRNELHLDDFILSLETNEDEFKYQVKSLTEQKGFCLLKMINYTITGPVFQEGVMDYFRKRADNESANFYSSLEKAENRNSVLPKEITFTDLLTFWTKSERYPVISVTRNLSIGQIILKQNDFGPIPEEYKWTIPISYSTNLDIDFSGYFKDWFMKEDDHLQIADSNGSENITWIIVNPIGAGYYRVNYEDNLWNSIISHLTINHNDFPILTRSILLDDALNLARSGILDYKIVIKLISCFRENENSLIAWKAILENFEFVYESSETLPNFLKLRNYLKELITPIYDKIENDSKDLSDLDFEEKKELQILVNTWACKLGFISCIEKMKDYFVKLTETGQLIQENFHQDEMYLILCTTIKFSGFDKWILLKNKMMNNTDESYLEIIIRALGCTREPSLISRYIEFLIEPNNVMSEHYENILEAVSQNQVALKYTLAFLYQNWIKVSEKYDWGELAVLFKKISTESDYKTFQYLFLKYKSTFSEDMKDILKNILHCIKLTLNWQSSVGIKITNDVLFNIEN